MHIFILHDNLTSHVSLVAYNSLEKTSKFDFILKKTKDSPPKKAKKANQSNQNSFVQLCVDRQSIFIRKSLGYYQIFATGRQTVVRNKIMH